VETYPVHWLATIPAHQAQRHDQRGQDTPRPARARPAHHRHHRRGDRGPRPGPQQQRRRGGGQAAAREGHLRPTAAARPAPRADAGGGRGGWATGGPAGLRLGVDEEPAQLLTPAGRVVVSPEVAAEPLPDTDQRRDVLVRSRAGADPLAFTTTTAAEERTRFLATILGRGSGLLLVVGTGTDISDAAAGHVQDALLLGGPPAAATAGVGAWLLAGAALRPAAPSRRRAWASAPSVGQVLLPGVSVLTRLVSEVREAAATRVHTTLAQAAEGADPSLPGRLRALLRVPEGARCSELERLRRAPRQPGSGPGPGDGAGVGSGLGGGRAGGGRGGRVRGPGEPGDGAGPARLGSKAPALARHGWAARLRRWSSWASPGAPRRCWRWPGSWRPARSTTRWIYSRR